MPSAIPNTNKGHGGQDFVNDDMRIVLLASGYTFNADHDFVSDLTSELSGTGYSRKTLAGKTLTINDTSDRGIHDADDVVYTGANFTGGDVYASYLYEYNASDAAAQLRSYNQLTTPQTTNGGDYTHQWDATNGIYYGS
jgi:hypothetical protein